jgi:hypothetical protein
VIVWRIKSNGKWFAGFVVDGEVQASGYCAFNCLGHDTQEEAERHYYEYQIKTAIYSKFHTDENIMYRCEHPFCQEFTRKLVKPGGSEISLLHLCPRHSNEKGLRKAWPFVSMSAVNTLP